MTVPMWITLGISTASLVIAVIGYLAAASLLARAVAAQRELSELQRTCEKLVSGSLQSRLSSIEDAIAELSTSVRMSKVRRAALVEAEPRDKGRPNPYTDPDGWRNAVNAELGQAKIKGTT